MQRNERDKGYLWDILESSTFAISYVEGVSKEDFISDFQLQDAVIRRLEIIGEAARRVSDETRILLSELPFDDMTGMRNILVHEYGDIDIEVVWDTIEDDLPPLISALEKWLDKED